MYQIKMICILIILTGLFIAYLIFNAQNAQYMSSVQILNTSDILQLLQEKPSNNFKARNISLFGLQLKYKVAPASCENKTRILIIVTSHLNNVENRSAMRRTFDTTMLEILQIRRVFLLGTVLKETGTSQAAIEDESIRFKDILQGNFIEAYRNLTYKHLMGLKWSSDHCLHTKYIIKMDDDIVMDLRKVSHFLNSWQIKKKRIETFLAGYVLENMVPKREPANKWFVTEQEYPGEAYPTFLSGWFYFTNPETARQLFLASKVHRYFWIDDTFITGILAQMLNIRHMNLSQYYALHPELIWCCIDDYVKHHFECPYFVGPNGGDANLYVDFNAAVGVCSIMQCATRKLPINETCIVTARPKLSQGQSIPIESYKLF